MTIHFSINYITKYGEDLYITGSTPQLGSDKIEDAVKMDFNNSFEWTKSIEIEWTKNHTFTYRYFVKCGNSFLFEVGAGRAILLNKEKEQMLLHDQWQGNDSNAPFLTAPFTDLFFTHKIEKSHKRPSFHKEIIIRATIPLIEKDNDIYICGDSTILGEWDTDKAIKMTPLRGAKWEICLNADTIPQRLEFKFLKKNSTSGEILWENGTNRILIVPTMQCHSSHLFEYSSANFPPIHPHFFGTAIPVFSLRTKNGSGIGEFSDLKPFADWVASIGQSFIQILPINDTTSTKSWLDSYPYGAISVMALHPIYLNLPTIGTFNNKKDTTTFNKECKILNDLHEVDYEKVLNLKMKYLHILFDKYSKEHFSDKKFKSFYKDNKGWLDPYCAFCSLRDKYSTADFTKWGKDSRYSHQKCSDDNFYLFLQYHLHLQLSDAVSYIHSKGIALKGDIPIGITPNSVDAWVKPQLFNMTSQAGAPPDDFSAEGQNWGFPTYNWNAMEKDNYQWWRDRFQKMAQYFDAYRIDHVLGFFRIWEIPTNQISGLMGHFSPALPYTLEEIEHFGYSFDFYRDTKPYIRYYQLREIFGDQVDMVMDRFLESNQFEVFTLKSQFDTQKKIEIYFNGAESDIKDALMALVGEVLFIEDPIQNGKFHPKISAQFTYSYKALSEESKRAFNTLYDNFFYKRHNHFWGEEAMKKLPQLISSTNMLTCAEDLGMIPDCVPEVVNNLKMLSLEIQRMPKDPKMQFALPSQYPYLSVATTGTHDTSTIRGWWEESEEIRQSYFNTILHEKGKAPFYCEPWICEKIINQHIHSSSMLVILPLQDWLSTDGSIRNQDTNGERINNPANPKHYWRYRMHMDIEDLLRYVTNITTPCHIGS